MDALKRAEKARQAEASSDGAELDLAATQGFSLDPIEESASGERPLPREPTLDQSVSPSDTDSGGSGGLSLEDTRAMQGRLGVEGDDEGARSLDDSGGRSLDDSISIVDEEEAVDVPHSIPSDTSATLPSLKQAQRSVDNYFDGTGSSSLTRDDLRSAMSEETAPQQRVAGDTETQRRVRAVFHAKEASRSRRGSNWVVIGLLPLLLLIVVGGVVYLYWDGIQEIISGKPTFVQSQRTAPAAPQRAPAPAAPAGATAAAPPAPAASAAAPRPAAGATPGTAAADGGTASSSETAAPTAPAAAESATEDAEPGMTALSESAPRASDVMTQSGGSGRRLSAEEYVEEQIRRAGLAPSSPTGGTAFKIRRETKPDRLHPRLARAYEAWRSGNLAEAKRDYEGVLKTDPRNRDALLGLGAIAVRTGQWDEASTHYTTLLRLNPRDSIAQTGLIAVHENVDPLRGESQIKLLLREEPDAAHLHFTLGNMYADQDRWGEAQSAYFNAYRLDSDNPDYAYNVAVSLDQLGKGKAAADYYRRALELAALNGAAFNQPSVRERLLRLAFEGSAQ